MSGEVLAGERCGRECRSCPRLVWAGAVAKESQILSWLHWLYRDTMLQALRFVIQGAGAKVDAVIRKNIVSLLLSMLGHDEVQLQVDGGLVGWMGFPSLFFRWCVSFVLSEIGTAASSQ